MDFHKNILTVTNLLFCEKLERETAVWACRVFRRGFVSFSGKDEERSPTSIIHDENEERNTKTYALSFHFLDG